MLKLFGTEPTGSPAEPDGAAMKNPGGAGTGRRPIVLGTALALVLAALASPAEEKTPTTPPEIEAEALAALNRMGAYLRTMKAFQVEAVTTTDDVLEDGRTLQSTGTVNLVARMPDRLRVEVANDRQERLYLYDGRRFTLWGRIVNFYATMAAPPTIGRLADRLENDHGIEVPLVDLFRWGAPGRNPPGITAAIDAGPSQVGGVTCEHYAFRQEGMDWQIWIQNGDYPLPRKLVLTTLSDEARPQHTATYTWNLAPSINDATFAFDPPAGAQRVDFAEIRSAAGAGKR